MRVAALVVALAACGPGERIAHAPDTRAAAVASVPADAAVAPASMNDPLAGRLCDALHRVPARALAGCCGVTNEAATPPDRAPATPDRADLCTRRLSALVRDGALSLDPAALSRCEQAIVERVRGCDWVTPLATVAVPACAGLVHGMRDAGAPCRSALECKDGLACVGSGVEGRCTEPAPDGSACRPQRDELAGLTGQDDILAARHPICAGACQSRRCVPRVALGGACTSRAACGPAARCAAGVCVAGATAALGEPCDGGSPCAPGASCRDGHCAALKKTGEACAGPNECAASCVTPPGSREGLCGPRCP